MFISHKIRTLIFTACVCMAAALPGYAGNARSQPRAGDVASNLPFIVGWYAMNHGPPDRITFDLSAFEKLDAIHGSAKGTSLVMYTWGKNGPWFFKHIGHLLDTAKSRGASVIMQVPIDYLTKPAPREIQKLAAAVSDHPGLLGWYTADEPFLNVARKWHDDSPKNLRLAYRAVKSVTDKPVFVCFTAVSLRPHAYTKYFKKPNHPTITDYADTFDMFMIDPYPAHAGQKEYGGMEYFLRGVKDAVRASHTIFKGKPWGIVPQAFGSGHGERHTLRLPTLSEYRFYVFWPILNGARSEVNFALYRNDASRYAGASGKKDKYAYARPNEPYPYDGQRWLKDVATPVNHVLSRMQNALSAGPVAGGAGSSNEEVKAAVFMNGDTHERWLLVANGSNGKVSTQVKLNLDHPVTRLDAVEFDKVSGGAGVSGGTGASPIMDENNGQVELTLPPYGVAVFELK